MTIKEVSEKYGIIQDTLRYYERVGMIPPVTRTVGGIRSDHFCPTVALGELTGSPCTACRYCTEACPQSISIPDLFACLNAKKLFNNWNTGYYYEKFHTKNGSRAKDCVKCGACEGICPQQENEHKGIIDKGW